MAKMMKVLIVLGDRQPFRRSLFLLVLCLASCTMRAQIPIDSPANNYPAMMGNLSQGSYSNHAIGFTVQLDPSCAIADEAGAVESVHKFPQRLGLSIRCADYTLTLVSWPLHPDESADLITQSGPSLSGAMDGLKDSKGLTLKRRGSWQKLTAGGTQVVVQELAARGHSGEAVLGLYNGFLIGRRYVCFLVIGPKKSEQQLRHIVTTLRLDATPAK